MNRQQFGRILTCFVIKYSNLDPSTAVNGKKRICSLGNLRKAMVLRRAVDGQCLRNVSVVKRLKAFRSLYVTIFEESRIIPGF
jgi:hypothetical protein